jgi:hypothetical protein
MSLGNRVFKRSEKGPFGHVSPYTLTGQIA